MKYYCYCEDDDPIPIIYPLEVIDIFPAEFEPYYISLHTSCAGCIVSYATEVDF
jgi:hypothetical protein